MDGWMFTKTFSPPLIEKHKHFITQNGQSW